ncbi:putative oxidoreductase [Sphingomonas laterariae]|uniref:Putative oxidoreductase n=1 Tax=Edaphosphingomonas laterariae TaxID=861865 RepID=A0A239BMD3_9SPHN|nr:DoxX family protein [Sphingomonas laterariae]SNS08779.1 putative oxidoreductase [Sphingomonas laterariae]
MIIPALDRHASTILGVLRIVTGLLFLSHGLVKLWGFPAGAQPGVQPLMSLLGAAAILELVGGILTILGLFTRPTAFLLSGQMAVAYFLVHAPQSFYPVLNGGEPSILFCFIFLYLAAAGAGAFSIDGMKRRS